MKKLATLIMTVLFCLGLGFCFTACDNGNQSGGNNAYKITVLDESGAAVEGVQVQLCDPATGTCLTDVFITNAAGKVSCAVPQKVYDIHVFTQDAITEYEIVGADETPATYGEITINIIME